MTLEVSLLDRLTVTPPGGAGEERLTANMVDCPRDATIPGARTTAPAACTVIAAVALAMFGAAALAVMVALPCAMGITGTLTVVAEAANVTVAGTVAASVLLDVRFTVKPPAGAGPDRFNARFCGEDPEMVSV